MTFKRIKDDWMKTEADIKKKRTVKRVALRAYWGNGDANSEIRMPLSSWKKILDGMGCEKGGYSWYEGRRHHVVWRFNMPYRQGPRGTFSIDGEDGRQCIVDANLSDIYVRELEKD